jgi:hypothetical protein
MLREKEKAKNKLERSCEGRQGDRGKTGAPAVCFCKGDPATKNLLPCQLSAPPPLFPPSVSSGRCSVIASLSGWPDSILLLPLLHPCPHPPPPPARPSACLCWWYENPCPLKSELRSQGLSGCPPLLQALEGQSLASGPAAASPGPGIQITWCTCCHNGHHDGLGQGGMPPSSP